jgi:predicted sulfurtransferase
MRDFVQRTPLPPSKDYVTLSFYQFRPIDEMDVAKIQYYFLTDLRAMDVVGRIYVSTEGINAQISCPKDRVDKFKDYYSKHWPIFDKIRFNPAMSEGRAFKKLHVRAKKQVRGCSIHGRNWLAATRVTHIQSIPVSLSLWSFRFPILALSSLYPMGLTIAHSTSTTNQPI